MRLADKAIDGKDGDVNARRLQVDTRKWFTSKLAPKLYGEKVDVTSDGKRIQSLLVLPPES